MIAEYIFLLSRHTRSLINQADKIRLHDQFPFLSNLLLLYCPITYHQTMEPERCSS